MVDFGDDGRRGSCVVDFHPSFLYSANGMLTNPTCISVVCLCHENPIDVGQKDGSGSRAAQDV